MTRPDGEAFINVHADTSPYERELNRGIGRASNDAEELLDELGAEWGETVADSMADELGRHGRDFADSVEDGISREVIHIRGKRYTVDRTGRLHDAAGRFVANFTSEVEDAFTRATAGGGGVFNRIGTAIADAVGSGFNVSGRSPLIALLLPAIGAIVGLILAAVQAAGALVAVLTTIPAVIAGIGLQVGTLVIAFQGVGEAVKGAFAAKNAKELQEAVKGLTPPAQEFVKSLLPLKPLFKEIQRVTQSNFFRALGDPVALLKGLGPDFIRGFGLLATQLGRFFSDLARFFASPTFVSFVRDVFPATGRWIQKFGPAFIAILSSLISMADQALPFLEKLGTLLTLNLTSLARLLGDEVFAGGFDSWLGSMLETFRLVMEVVGQATKFLATFLAQLDQAGGKELLKSLADAFETLTFFLASPVGLKMMEGLVDLSIASIKTVTGLIILIGLVIAGVELVGEALHEFWRFLTQVVGPAIADFFSGLLNKADEARDVVGDRFITIKNRITEVFSQIGAAVQSNLTKAIDFVRGLPDRARTAIGDLGRLLYNSGRALIQGLINGIRSMFGSLGNAARDAVGQITRFLPGSPAEEGPLSGSGYSLYRGQRMIDDLGRGMRSGFADLQQGMGSDLGALVGMLSPSTSTSTGVNFGPGSIRVAFEGVVPTEEEARRTGRAVGAGISDQLARRDTVLAVRTI